MELNLTANGKPQELILAYLCENASEVLAEKINSGVPVERDGKSLTSRKTLDGFMKYASGEARKLAEKGAQYACVDDATVYGWAIHYFEEDSIEGTLYNADGSEYRPEVKASPKPATKQPAKPKNVQPTLFDLMQEDNAETESADDEGEIPDEEETRDIQRQLAEEETVEEQSETEETVKETAEEEPVIEETHEPKKNDVFETYSELKRRFPNAVVLQRLGDFYEVLGKDAISLSAELGLTLTSRDCGLTSRLPMIGFPYHAADVYVSKMASRGHRIVISENGGVREWGQTTNTQEPETNSVPDVITRLFGDKVIYK